MPYFSVSINVFTLRDTSLLPMKGGGLSDKDYVNTRGTAATNKKLSNAFGYTVNYVISFAM